MLQVIHQRNTAPRASSIYCRWIQENRGEGARLVAVWIDSEMRCFEREAPRDLKTEAAPQGALEDPGGVAVLSSRGNVQNRKRMK
jgi:hypothetical protein